MLPVCVNKLWIVITVTRLIERNISRIKNKCTIYNDGILNSGDDYWVVIGNGVVINSCKACIHLPSILKNGNIN